MILNGSPRKKGTTSALVKSFTKGAESAGHIVTEFSWLAGIFMAARAALADTAAGNVLVSRRTTWINLSGGQRM